MYENEKLCNFAFKNPNLVQSLKKFAQPYGRTVAAFRNSALAKQFLYSTLNFESFLSYPKLKKMKIKIQVSSNTFLYIYYKTCYV